MKKNILLLALIGGLAASADAQTLSIGAKAGGTYAGLEGKDTQNFSYKVGVHAGLMADLAFLDNTLSIHPEVLYSLKGFESNDALVKFPDIDMNYVDVPVLVRYKANGIFVEAGPQVSLLLGADSKGTDAKPLFKTVTYDYAVGFGLESELGVSLGVRYNGGVNYVFKPVEVGTNSSQVRAKPSAFLISLGYYFIK